MPRHDLAEAIKAGLAASPDKSGLDAFAYAIRQRAKQTQTVGADLMGIVIRGGGANRVEWTFMPETPHHSVGPDGTILNEVTYSPWIIAPDRILGPTLGTGQITLTSGDWEVVCLNPPTGSGTLVFELSGQTRPPPP
jgi:hypothetical protein